ncbi:AraC family transcriptional regulator [Rhizobium sp. P32RR-XVIII]|uniref:GlxA family transcriptional regulator n=1 Tax=Rhizobium sp. P32RR-XVIII TaxID=2726738 RepID=UPI001456E938|nr:AraC family transcriptional regulator [Rhizobium sp. P32RR-XVIII]NLS05059.1 AraC family transcriptional regulator [Rhizobium sp. P32RR-XVIII]
MQHPASIAHAIPGVGEALNIFVCRLTVTLSARSDVAKDNDPGISAIARHVVILVYPGFVLLDLSGPIEALSIANQLYGKNYLLTVASIGGGLVRSSSGVEVATERLERKSTDTFIVAGALGPPDGPWVGEVASAIRDVSTYARRTACICTGAFLVAESGLLSGRSATTHWAYVQRLQAEYPSLRVDGDRIFTHDDGVWTSAGMTAGSIRQFSRAFAAATGMTPAKAIERLRVEAARPLVEDSRQTLDEIARHVGFVDPDRLTQSFFRITGHTPSELRRMWRRAQ